MICAALIIKAGLLGCNTMLFYRWVSGQKVITVQCQVEYCQNHGFQSSETWCCIISPWHYKCDVPSSKDETVKLWELPSAEIIPRPYEYNPPKCPIQHGNTFLAWQWHPQDSSWTTPMPTPIWTPADKQVHRPTAICHQDSLWDDMDFFKTIFFGFSISNLDWYDLHSHEQNAAQAQCRDSWPPVKIFRLLWQVRNMLHDSGYVQRPCEWGGSQ